MNRAQKFFLCLLAVAVAGSSIATSALAYVIGGSRWPADVPCSGAACLSQPFTLTYSYVNMFDGGMKTPGGSLLPNALIKGSIEEALRVWGTAVPVNFVEVPNNGTAQLQFRHLFINGPDPAPPADPTTKAQATCVGYGSGCRVEFDDSDPWQEVGEQAKPDVLGATIHEVGHILGLQHSDVVGVNMYWIFHRFQGLGTGKLFDDDIAGIQVLYGAGTGSLTPIGVPEPATFTAAAAALLSTWSFLARRIGRRWH